MVILDCCGSRKPPNSSFLQKALHQWISTWGHLPFF